VLPADHVEENQGLPHPWRVIGVPGDDDLLDQGVAVRPVRWDVIAVGRVVERLVRPPDEHRCRAQKALLEDLDRAVGAIAVLGGFVLAMIACAPEPSDDLPGDSATSTTEDDSGEPDSSSAGATRPASATLPTDRRPRSS
jgi:hypothetical protein